MMNDADPRIREIEARLLASTPGPWQWIGYDLVHPRRNWDLLQAAGGLESFVPGLGKPPTVVLGVAPIEIYPDTYHWIVPNRLDDFEFIEHSREDIEYLLSELRKARRQLAELQSAAE